jgi:hypothetical protein
MAIDPLDWAGDRLLVLGPSTGPRPAPRPPAVADLFAAELAEGLGPGWRVQGRLRVKSREALAEPAVGERAVARREAGASSFLAVVSVRLLEEKGACGIGLDENLRLLLTAEGRAVLVRVKEAGEERLDLRGGLSPGAFHRMAMEVDGARVRLFLDDLPLWSGRIAPSPDPPEVALLATGGPAGFSGFSITLGWEALFYPETGDPAELGWEVLSGTWRLTGRELAGEAGDPEAAEIVKGPLFADYELVINLRLLPGADPDVGWGLYPVRTAADAGPLLALVRSGPGWALAVRGTALQPPERLLPFPPGFDPSVFQQMRFEKAGGCLEIAWEDHSMGEIVVSPEPARPGLLVRRAAVEVDAVRVTARP